jgi:tRNA G18 (ribose-2'-O)-methylase SpoU
MGAVEGSRWVAISDPDDPRIEPYRSVRERDLVGRQGRFIVEGAVPLQVLLTRSRFPVESVLLSENQLGPLSGRLSALPADVPIFVAGRAVMDAIVGFPIHRGILAVGLRPPDSDLVSVLADLPEPALVVGLVGLANHDNVGGIFRNAAAFGADAVLLDSETCDPLYRKAIRVSAGGVLTVPWWRMADAAGMVESLRRARFEVLSLSPSGRIDLNDLRITARTALLLGAEGPGLPRPLLDQTTSVSIPMRPGFDSLNVATTSGIVLHHVRSRSAQPA